MKVVFRYLGICVLFIFVGCSSSNQTIDINKDLKIPQNYNSAQNTLEVKDDWLLAFKNDQLTKLVNKAINNNYELKQLYYDINISKKELMVSGSYFFPEAELAIENTTSGDFDGSSSLGDTSLGLNLSYEIDLWGKLSDSKKKANIELLESKAIYEEAKQKLISDVIIAYFNIVESNRLLEIYNKSLKKKQEQSKIIDSRYKQGLNSILDTYQTNNGVLEQLATISAQQSIKANAIFTLENLLGQYPKGLLDISHELPFFDSKIELGLPNDLITRKASLSASWSRLLAQNYQLAFTHKQRLPSLNLSSSLAISSDTGTPVVWSLISGITAPIFNAKRLKANEQIEELNLKKLELAYLNDVYSAYLDIENLIVKEKNLKEQYSSILRLEKNSKISSDLAYSQYLKGLVEYTTVIENQNSYYDSLSSLIQIKNELLQTRVQLHLALGGDFISRKNKKEK